MKTIRHYVEEVLRDVEQARNDDKVLVIEVLKRMGFVRIEDGNIVIRLEDLDKLPAFESIRRERQRIQNQELRYLPTDVEVLVLRKIYDLTCPVEKLREQETEPRPPEYYRAICRRCPKYRTDDCQLPTLVYREELWKF